MRSPIVQGFTFLASFFSAIAVAVGVAILALRNAVDAAYTPYPEEPFILYSPLLLIPALVVIGFVARKRYPSSWLAQGLFFGGLVAILGVAVLVAVIAAR